MVTMENAEEVMQILERFTRLKQKEIPKELDEYLGYVAKTGDTVFKWANLKYLFREKLLNVIKQFYDTTPRIDEIPQYPNVDPFNYESMKSILLERLELFNAAPFTVQRLCELLIDPRKQYSRIDKFMRALEKNILVVSTVEPGRKRTDSENGDSLDSVVNGDLLLDVNVDIDMEADSLLNMETQAQNNIQNTTNGITTISTSSLTKNDANGTLTTLSPSSQDDVDDGDKDIASKSKECTIKLMSAHTLDDDILPHPKKVKLDIMASNDEEQEEDGIGCKEEQCEIKFETLNDEESIVKQDQKESEGNNEESANKIVDEEVKKTDLENEFKPQQQQELTYELEKEIEDDEKLNLADSTTAVTAVPITSTTTITITTKPIIRQPDDNKANDKTTTTISAVTKEGNEQNEMVNINDEVQNIDKSQAINQDEIVGNKQSVKDGQIKVLNSEEVSNRKEDGKEQMNENLTGKKINHHNDDSKAIISGQEPMTIIKDVIELKNVEAFTEKQVLKECEQDQNNVKIIEDNKREVNETQEANVNEKLLEGETNKIKNKEGQQEPKEKVEDKCNPLKEEEDLLELQLLSNKTEELVEVFENNEMETIHEDLEEAEETENVEKEECKNINLEKKTDNSNNETQIVVPIIVKKLDESLDNTSNLFKTSKKCDGKLLVEIVEEIQQKKKIDNIDIETKEVKQQQEYENEQKQIDVDVMQSVTKIPTITTEQAKILNETPGQNANATYTNEANICDTVGMAAEITQQILSDDIAVPSAPSISGDSIIILPTIVKPTVSLPSALINVPIQGDQPMIEDVTIEEAPPTVEEVVMAEPPLQLPSSQQLNESITNIISINAVMDIEPSNMDVDDTSQEAMDQ